MNAKTPAQSPTSLTPSSSRFAAPCPARRGGPALLLLVKLPATRQPSHDPKTISNFLSGLSDSIFEACFRRGSKHKGC